MRRVLASAVLLIVVGCGSSTAKVATTTVESSSSAASALGSTPRSVTAANTSAPTTPTPSDVAGNPVDGAAFCAFLTEDLPALKSAGSPAGALAQFAGDFGTWLDTHATQKPRIAADLDSASEGACPDVRSQAVAALGAASFNQALG